MFEDDDIKGSVMRWLMPKLPGVLDRIGRETVEDIKARLGTPCPAYHGGGGGHSPPGHEPYMETGALVWGMKYQVELGDNPSVAIISTRPLGGDSPNVPFWLEYGTKKMAARPYMRPARNRGEDRVPRTLRMELGA